MYCDWIVCVKWPEVVHIANIKVQGVDCTQLHEEKKNPAQTKTTTERPTMQNLREFIMT